MQSRKEEEVHLLDYWRVLSKRREIAITFFAAVVGIVTLYSFVTTPVYQGTVQVLVDLEKNPTMTFVDGGTGVIQMKDAAEYYNTQTEILNSRTFADRVVKKLQLDKSPYFLDKKDKINNGLLSKSVRSLKASITSLFPEKEKPADPIKVAVPQELDPDLTDLVLAGMKVEVGKQSNILKISYESENPNVAASMANGIADAYIEHNIDIRVKPFRDAVEWLSERIVELRAKVEDSEKSLQQYREEKGIVSFDTKENVITQKLQELVSQLVQAETDRQEAEVKYNQIKSVIGTPDLLATVPDIMNNLVIQGLRNEELELKKQVSELSDRYGPKHPQMIKAKSQLEVVQKNLILEARKMLNAAKTEFEIKKNRESSIRKTMDDQKQEVLTLSRKAIEFNVVAGESDSNKQFYELLLKKLQEASLSSGINISNVQIVDGAVTPKLPISPKRGMNILLSLAVGLFGGIFSAFFVEYMDDTVKAPEDVENGLGLPFLGMIPSATCDGPLYLLTEPKSMTAESYRTIRTGLMLSAAGKPPQVILITSSTPDEGKTTTAANLAAAMSQMGEKVLLIDADMRRHNIHKVFNVDNSLGLSNVIAGQSDFPSVIKSIPQLPSLNILTGGTLAPNPSELLSSNKMKELVDGLRQSYDRIIIDSPPLMAVSDPLILSRLSDGVVLVVWGGNTGQGILKKGCQSLEGVNAKILGVALNNVRIGKKGYYYYPYYHAYVDGAGENA